MKKILLLMMLLTVAGFTYAQVGSAKVVGTITDSSGDAVEYATVALLNTTKGTTSDAKGNFTISGLQSGKYTVFVSAIGYQTKKEVVEVQDREVRELSVALGDAPSMLNEVVITSRKRDQRKENLTASITSINTQLLQEQQQVSNNPIDILAVTVPGMGHASGTSSNWGQTLRGRQILVMVDGVPQSTPLRNGSVDVRTIDPHVLQGIEVLKGATSIYGNGAAGGVINYITKDTDAIKSFSSKTQLASTGSLTNTKESIGGRINQSFYGKAGKLGYIVSGGYEQTGVARDADGDIIGPIYGMSNLENRNAFGKLSYDITAKQHVQVSYNYFGSQIKSHLTEAMGSIKQDRKTTAVPGTVQGSPEGTRWNHNGLLKYSYDSLFLNTNVNVSAYVQDISTVFVYSPTFEGGGQSTIQSSKKGLRFDLNTPFGFGSNVNGDLIYGLDLLNDVTSQPLLDGRTWVPKMDMVSTAPFLQLQAKFFNDLVFNGGVRFENINIGVPDYTTLKPYNNNTKTFGNSVNVKGGELQYNNLVFNSGLKYNRFDYFKPFVNFSQGFSVADLGVLLRRATVNDIALIQTEAVIVNNYEAGFASENRIYRVEATAFISQSDLGSSFVEQNGFYNILRLPERVHGFEIAADVNPTRDLTVGATYSYVEGKRDVNDNGKFTDTEDTYLGGERISAPKFTAYVRYAPIKSLNLRADLIGSGERDRFTVQESTGLYKVYEGKVSPYSIVNFAASYRMSPSTTFNLGVENLFNADYFPARSQFLMFDQYYIKGRGASFTLGLTVEI
ncbi:TonB-dependent receptor [Pontibacter cellulosilyticus]|uniref:TonB-dependent receptor n=1 Tax=Pontibacter cellulosilyticus TaxID=1720253 RepID=A0A923SK73_9BACT|nr:TonB-dependent receptor [Pontibacter cellulosilyticus]MBC5994568.1 TonB-dependent receptor [Pontibacter cellulosilyticus]